LKRIAFMKIIFLLMLVTVQITFADDFDKLQADADIQYELALIHLSGNGVPVDKVKAGQLLISAAEQGHIDAQFNLGVMYHKGDGLNQNHSEGVKWHGKAAEQGSPSAHYALASSYSTGRGVAKSETKAVKWLRSASELGHLEAQGHLALNYALGLGVPKDVGKALKLWREPADQGDTHSQWNLAQAYYNGLGVKKNEEKAFEWFRLAAEGGDGRAQAIISKRDNAGENIPERTGNYDSDLILVNLNLSTRYGCVYEHDGQAIGLQVSHVSRGICPKRVEWPSKNGTRVFDFSQNGTVSRWGASLKLNEPNSSANICAYDSGGNDIFVPKGSGAVCPKQYER